MDFSLGKYLFNVRSMVWCSTAEGAWVYLKWLSLSPPKFEFSLAVLRFDRGMYESPENHFQSYVVWSTTESARVKMAN